MIYASLSLLMKYHLLLGFGGGPVGSVGSELASQPRGGRLIGLGRMPASLPSPKAPQGLCRAFKSEVVVAGWWLDGPLWVGEARLRGSGNRVNFLSGRVGGS